MLICFVKLLALMFSLRGIRTPCPGDGNVRRTLFLCYEVIGFGIILTASSSSGKACVIVGGDKWTMNFELGSLTELMTKLIPQLFCLT